MQPESLNNKPTASAPGATNRRVIFPVSRCRRATGSTARTRRCCRLGTTICNSEGSRAAAVEAEPGGVVPSERTEIQVRSDRATGAGELVKFGELVWYRFSFKIAGDWPQDVPAVVRQPCRRHCQLSGLSAPFSGPARLERAAQ